MNNLENNNDKISYIFGKYLIDISKRELRLNNVEVKIQALVFDLLVYLLENRDRVIDKNELFETIWPDVVITDAAMARTIMKARKAVGDDANKQTVIKTSHGYGYRFVAKIEIVNATNTPEKPDTAETIQVQEPVPDQIHELVKTKTFRQPAIYIIGTFLLALVFFVIVVNTTYLNSPEPVKTVAELKYHPNSIAVLPFVNISNDPANEYFSDGISEELLHMLTKLPKLQVVSSSSSFSFKDKDLDIPTIASRLNVAYILNGSVRKSGKKIRVTVQLTDVHSNSHLWSETYDRTLDDIFAIQDDIAEAVAEELKVTLHGNTPTAKKIDIEAYTLYLQARHLGSLFTTKAFEQSNNLYKKALAIDPNYAEAWSGLATNYLNQTLTGHYTAEEGFSLAQEAADRSLLLDPEQAITYALVSRMTLRFKRDLQTSAKYLKEALKLEPNNTGFLLQAATLTRSLGHLNEAIAINKYVTERDPINPVSHYFLGFSYLLARQYDDAIASFRNALMMSPKHVSVYYRIGTALFYTGEHKAALTAFQQEKGMSKKLMGQVMIYHELGQNRESDTALAELIDKYEHTSAYNIAYLLAFRGETDRAFDWLNKAVKYNDTGLVQIAFQPEFDNIHDDPRWLPFLENIGMTPKQLNTIKFKVKLPL